MCEFNAHDYIVRQPNKILIKKRMLKGLNSKPGKIFPKETIGTVSSVYESDEVRQVNAGY